MKCALSQAFQAASGRSSISLSVAGTPPPSFGIAGGDLGRGELACGRRELLDDGFADAANAEQAERRGDPARRIERVDLGAGELVVGQVAVAFERAVPGGAGHVGLERQHRLRRPARVRVAGLAEREGQVIDVLGPDLPVAVIVDQIVVAVGQAEPVLADIERVAVALLLVGIDEQPDRRGEAGRGEQRDQFVGGLRRRDPVEPGPGRRQARAFDRRRYPCRPDTRRRPAPAAFPGGWRPRVSSPRMPLRRSSERSVSTLNEPMRDLSAGIS